MITKAQHDGIPPEPNPELDEACSSDTSVERLRDLSADITQNGFVRYAAQTNLLMRLAATGKDT